MTLNDLMKYKAYELDYKVKENVLGKIIHDLTIYHYENCEEYKRILDAYSFDPYRELIALEEFPMLPVRIFKELSLKSVPDSEMAKQMTSSGSSGQKVSRLYLDRQTAIAQQNVGVKITSSFLGIKRMPFIIIDSPSVVKSRQTYSARGAAAMFFSLFGSDRIYALKEDMSLDLDTIKEFLEKHQGKPILLFGFTFMVWQHLYLAVKKLNEKLDFNSAILIHSGGWKKMEKLKVSEDIFEKSLKEEFNIARIYQEYGMAEQSGTIYYQCEYGHYHTSIYSDVIARRSNDLSPCEIGETGILELISSLPHSYPGHVILSEDQGVICGIDDCPCGRLGKYFKLKSRIKNAEIRGCSDTYGMTHSE